MKDQIIRYIRAGFSGLYILTHEEIRAEAEIKAAATELDYTLYRWTILSGLLNTATGAIDDVADPVGAVDAILELPEKSIVILTDFHLFLADPDPVLYRAMKENLRRAAASGKVLVITGCTLTLPAELEKEFTVIEHVLPDEAALSTIAENLLTSANITIEDDQKERAVQAARGLTSQEAENIMALSIVSEHTLCPELIAREKALAVKKDGLLEIIEPTETIDSIGGLDELKSWLLKRRRAFGKDAAAYGLPSPKGMLILGIPGTGKSLTAKAASSILQRPILKLDAGRLFGGIVGQSEQNLRRAIQTAEAISPCVLHIDEIDKAFAGSKSSGSTDGGTTARVFGSFLSWLQDKTAPVFVLATANDVSKLPPELLRKGRMDEIFFVDLPDQSERACIWRIQIGKYHRDPEEFDIVELARVTDGFTGSEIEQLFVEALYAAFDEDREPDMELLLELQAKTVPLSRLMAEDIRQLREWAQGRARPAGKVAEKEPGLRRVAV